ncbi:hypothetical protein [uncultured Sphingobium sp.]|uniref:hypothetical protein n=1 Tax=uncultured Sphingobium sp. TaxID=316087 RepID=UPI00259B821A|nr:hypothetical protein [uncultured Sphingobium sp.]
MTIGAYLVIDDGETYAETVQFDVKPETGEVLHWMAGGNSGHAEVIAIEHRQTPDSFCFTVLAKSIDLGDSYKISAWGD